MYVSEMSVYLVALPSPHWLNLSSALATLSGSGVCPAAVFYFQILGFLFAASSVSIFSDSLFSFFLLCFLCFLGSVFLQASTLATLSGSGICGDTKKVDIINHHWAGRLVSMVKIPPFHQIAQFYGTSLGLWPEVPLAGCGQYIPMSWYLLCNFTWCTFHAAQNWLLNKVKPKEIS